MTTCALTVEGIEVVTKVTAVVPEILREEFPHRADLCVLATRIGFDACRYFGVDSHPVCVRSIAYNRAWQEFVDEHGWETTRPLPEEAWSVVIDESEPKAPGRYAGHLLLAVPGQPDSALLDLSLRQFSRPERGLLFPDAACYAVDLAAFKAGEPLTFKSGVDEDSFISYRFRPDAPDYRRGSDWRRKQNISGKVIRRLKAEL